MSNDTVTTNFLIVSETCGLIPDDRGDFRKPLPTAHVLIHAGNMTSMPTGEILTLNHFKRQTKWIMKAEIELKILVAGEHDTFWNGDSKEDEKIWEYLNSEEVKDAGVHLVNEKSEQFHLRNGAVFNVQALTIENSTQTPSTYACNKSQDPRIIISHCPISLDYSQALDCNLVYNHLSQAQPRLNIYNHRSTTWGAQVVSWTPDSIISYTATPIRKIRAEQQIKEDKYTGEKFVDLRVFGKVLSKNETMMINAGVFQDGLHNVKPVIVVSLVCTYKEVVEFAGRGQMESAIEWGRSED